MASHSCCVSGSGQEQESGFTKMPVYVSAVVTSHISLLRMGEEGCSNYAESIDLQHHS
jgi:hypothetical protein